MQRPRMAVGASSAMLTRQIPHIKLWSLSDLLERANDSCCADPDTEYESTYDHLWNRIRGGNDDRSDGETGLSEAACMIFRLTKHRL